MGSACGLLQCWGLTLACGLLNVKLFGSVSIFQTHSKCHYEVYCKNAAQSLHPISVTHVQTHTSAHSLLHTHTHRNPFSPRHIQKCALTASVSVSSTHPVLLFPPPSVDFCTNMAAPPKDTIYAYWQATLLVTKGHTVKILNLWRARTLFTPEYAEKAQKRCCVLCVWLYLLPLSLEQWPKGCYFIGLRCWLPHNVQKSPLFRTGIKAGIRMRSYPQDTHKHKHPHELSVRRKPSAVWGSVLGVETCRQRGRTWLQEKMWPFHPVKGWDSLTEKLLCPPSVFKPFCLQWKGSFKKIKCLFAHREAHSRIY